MAKIKLVGDKYYFDAEDGSEMVECKVWLETSKKTEKHPDGIWWIKLPKDNITKRSFFSLAMFNETNVNGEVNVAIKTSGPRVLGTTGVKQQIIKYLDENTAEEYTNLVNGALEAFRAAKANRKTKRIEDMNVEELEAYIEAKRNGTHVSVVDGPKSFMDLFTEDEYNRYNEILALAQENKANAPRAKRGPLTDEEKQARKVKRIQNDISKAEKLLAALRANQNTETIVEDDYIAEDEDL